MDGGVGSRLRRYGVEHNIESGRTVKQLLAPQSGAVSWRLFHAV